MPPDRLQNAADRLSLRCCLRYAAQRPQRVLQAFRERHKTLAAEHNMGMLEARECQPEVMSR